MRLVNAALETLELHVLGYEFIEPQKYRHDANWLCVEIHCTHERGSWRAKAPCLLTWELERICNWFEALSRGESVEPRLRFIEPNLEFRLAPEVDVPTIRVYFEAEFRPDWAAWDDGIMRDLWLDFPIVDLDLPVITQLARTEYELYPLRTT